AGVALGALRTVLALGTLRAGLALRAGGAGVAGVALGAVGAVLAVLAVRTVRAVLSVQTGRAEHGRELAADGDPDLADLTVVTSLRGGGGPHDSCVEVDAERTGEPAALICRRRPG